MESPQYAPSVLHANHADSVASRPSLGFPLGTALLLIVIFSLSGIFSCCYHWDKFRTLRGAYADAGDIEAGSASDEKNPPNSDIKRLEIMHSVPVLMPGDQMPRFIALPCPCAPPHAGPELDLSLSTSSDSTTVLQPGQKPYKPPRFPVPMC